MSYNNISAELPPEVTAKIEEAVQTIKDNLPFLIRLYRK
jgi:hypothetical protein